MKKTYQFDVPAYYYYEIEAGSEAEARKILIDKGGIEIEVNCALRVRKHKDAQLVVF